MGCGSSALSSDDNANLNGHNNPRRRLRVVRPIADEPITKDDNNIVIAFPLINNSKKEELVGGEVKKKLVVETQATHDRDDDDDAFNGQSSPSFREYCKNLSLNTPNNISQDSTNDVDDSDSGESTNGNEVPSREMTTPNKENGKERKGRRFKDAINKGISMNKKMSFAFHRSTNKYNENSRKVAP